MTSPQQPHVWEIDADGEPKEFDSGDYHGGPRCVLCGDTFCRGCDAAGMNGPCIPDPDEQEGLPEQLRYWSQAYGKLAAKLRDAENRLTEAAKTIRQKEHQWASAERLAAVYKADSAGYQYQLAQSEAELAHIREREAEAALAKDIP